MFGWIWNYSLGYISLFWTSLDIEFCQYCMNFPLTRKPWNQFCLSFRRKEFTTLFFEFSIVHRIWNFILFKFVQFWTPHSLDHALADVLTRASTLTHTRTFIQICIRTHPHTMICARTIAHTHPHTYTSSHTHLYALTLVRVHTRIRSHSHALILARTHTRTRLHLHELTLVCAHIRTHLHLHVLTLACTYARMHPHLLTLGHALSHVHSRTLCVLIYTHKITDTA